MKQIKDVAKELIDGLESCFSDEKKAEIERRLEEIRKEENLTIAELDFLCWHDSAGMFDRIFFG